MNTKTLVFGGLVACAISAHAASGIYRDGIGAPAMALGGADVARAETSLGSFGANPAGAAWLPGPTLDLGFAGAIPDGHFNDAVNHDAPLHSYFGALPEGAFGTRLLSGKLGVVVGIAPDAALADSWDYVDPPGGATGTTSYGLRRDHSSILVLRSGVAVGWALTPKLSLGAGVGLIYNENRLTTPYVFQTAPALKGVKTLLDLDTDGFGVDGQLGLLYRPCDDLRFGLAYKSPTTVHSHGDASGNASTQLSDIGLGAARPDFHYDAQVNTEFPQVVSGGVFWQAHPRWGLIGQVDWINWGAAFDKLPVILRHGNNANLNGLVGVDYFEDDVPLRWKDQVVYRTGVEFTAMKNLLLRAGYSYGRNPVPNDTLTPLTAAIVEHTITTGLAYSIDRFQINLAYQYNFPKTVNIGTSALRSGEYSNSSIEVNVHWVALTISTRF